MSAHNPFLKLGTRGSPLALVQARAVRAALAAAHAIAADDIEIVIIKTTGDAIQDRALASFGGKGLFTKELDAAQIEGVIDIAVHSAKDLPTRLPNELVIAGYMTREDARDVLIATPGMTIEGLTKGARFGSASLRRSAMMLRLRPDLQISLLRGNVETRLRKIEEREFDATMLAYAGLRRLGLAHRATAILELADFLPAVGQGAVAITARRGDVRIEAALSPILHRDTKVALDAERAFLDVLDGSCRTPIAGHAVVTAGRVNFRGLVLRPDGSEAHEVVIGGAPGDAARLGVEAGRDLLARMPANILQPA